VVSKSILITGGTGSLGQALVKYFIDYEMVRKIIVFSRDEFKQVNMSRDKDFQSFKLRYFIGDIRDKSRLDRALKGVDWIVHCCALKHVSTCEYNPFEAIQTNVLGAQNLIEASIDNKVEKVIAVSTDKAVNPISLYGATKLCSDRLFLAASAYQPNGPKFSVIRFGNFIGSRGSVIPYFEELKAQGINEFPITDKQMMRYWIKLEDAVKYVVKSLHLMEGGEIFTPQMDEKSVVSIAKKIAPDATFKEIGRPKGEKLKEELFTEYDEVSKRGDLWVTRS